VSTSTTEARATARLLEALLERRRLGVRDRRAGEDLLRRREADFFPEPRRRLRLEELLRLLLPLLLLGDFGVLALLADRFLRRVDRPRLEERRWLLLLLLRLGDFGDLARFADFFLEDRLRLEELRRLLLLFRL